jgi:CRP/FNR family transcriptional regulator, cyclic AMP receptor protein
VAPAAGPWRYSEAMHRGISGPTVERLLDLDPDLAAGIDEQEWEAARGACRTTVIRVGRGTWSFPAESQGKDGNVILGLIVVEGALCREVALRDRHMFELLGPGDVVQASAGIAGPRIGGPVILTAVTDVALAVLDHLFVRAAARWPSLLTTLLGRLEAQHENMVIQGLIAHLPRAEHRVLLALRHLGERWGRVTPDGMLLPVALTHDLLGQLTAARRSTVTIAVTSLQRDGYIRRTDDRSWLVTPAGEAIIETLIRPSNLNRTLGQTLTLHQRKGEVIGESRALRAEARQVRARRRSGASPASPERDR